MNRYVSIFDHGEASHQDIQTFQMHVSNSHPHVYQFLLGTQEYFICPNNFKDDIPDNTFDFPCLLLTNQTIGQNFYIPSFNLQS
jgi:hypothetical protein